MPILPTAPALGRFVLAGLLGLGATGALAGDPEVVVSGGESETRAVDVRVADLDLASDFERRTLAIRIERAARAVCDVNRGSKLDRRPDALACLDEARAGALAQLEARGLPTPGAMTAGGGMP